MELERFVYPLLDETLYYLNSRVTGKVKNIVRNKNKFVFHVSLDNCEQINNDGLHLDVINEVIIPLSDVKPGLLLVCLHPKTKMWTRCYVISICHQQAYVAICDTGEITLTKQMKYIPDMYKNIPVTTFEAELKFIYPYDKLQHLMEYFDEYSVSFNQFTNKPNYLIHKKMKLTHKNGSLDFIINKWNPQNDKTMDVTHNSLIKNGSAVVIAKVENYDYRHIFVRSVDQFVNICKQLQMYCETASNIEQSPILGDIIAVKCVDKFYRGKIIDILDESNFSLYLIDAGYVISTSVDCLVGLSTTLQKIPSTVCLVGLKNITMKPWNQETYLYITTLFENSTTMILEYTDYDPLGLDSVTLTVINNNEDVNEHLKELLKYDQDPQNHVSASNSVEDLNSTLKLLNNKIIPVVVNVTKSDPQIISEDITKPLLPGSLVYMTGFVDLNEIYIMKYDDNNDKLTNFLDTFNAFCLSAIPISRPLVIGEIVGFQSPLNSSFYRGKVLRQIDNTNYQIQCIDFSKTVHILPIFHVIEIPKEFKILSNIISVSLKGLQPRPLNLHALEYISKILSECIPMIIDFSPAEHFTNVTLIKIDGNENVNEQLLKLLSNDDRKSAPMSDLVKKPAQGNMSKEIIHSDNNTSKLKIGDLLYIITFIDVHHIFVRKVKDETDDFFSFIDSVNLYCSAETPICKLPKLNDIIGAKSITDGIFYRAKLVKKLSDVSYIVHFIDYGIEEKVNLSNIVSLSTKFKEIPTTISLVKLKDIPFCKLNKDAHEYVTLISENETITIDYIDEDANDVILKTSENQNINTHLSMLLFGSNEKINAISTNKSEENRAIDEVVPVVTQNITECTMPSDETNLLKNGDHVFITAYIDLYNIFVRKVNINDDEFQKLTESVNFYCCLGNTSQSKPLELNEIVGAKSSDDGCFYRGRIIEKTDDKNYNVVFIDFGFEECVNITEIVPLPKQLQQVRPYVSLVGLKGLRFEKLNKESQTYLDNLTLNNDVMKIEFEDLSAVTLTVINQGQNLVDYLNVLCVNNTIVNNTITNNPVQGTLSPYGMKYISPDINIPHIPKLTNKSIVTIYAFINLNDISVSVVYNQLEMSRFLNDFSVFCMTSQPITRCPNVGEVYGVRSIDGSFNRGQITEILNEKQFKVIFFDFGHEEIVSANSIIEISEQLKQVPKIIYPVQLKNVNFKNLNAQALSYVNMLCENMPLIIEFDENNPDGLMSVMLTTTITQQNVNDHLILLLTEKEERDSPETVQMLCKGDIVYISSFVDLQSINVRRINNGTDKFKSFLEKFSSCCALETPTENEPKVGEIVAAKVENENKFYRAEVISRVDNEHYNVCFVDFGTRATVSWNNIVQPSDIRLQNCPMFIVSLNGLYPEPKDSILMEYIKEISQLDTFIIDSITEDHKVTLISVKTKCNINNEIQKLIVNSNIRSKIQNDPIDEDMVVDPEEFVVTYYKPFLEVPIQIWIAEKISVSRYLVHTNDSRVEYMRLEKQIFKDSKTFELVKSIKTNMPCIAYFCPNWYRGEILEVVNKTMARVRLVDIGNIVIRNIKEIFCIPSKYKGKSLLVNIELQPVPQEKLPIVTFKIVPKKHLDNITIAEVMASSISNQSNSDLESVGLPSFTSTPIPHEFDTFQFNDPNNMFTDIYQYKQISSPKSNMLTIKNVNYVKWLNGSLKLLTFLIVYKDCLIMRDHVIEEMLEDLEMKIQDFCKIPPKSYSPAENELCLAKFSDGLWYRAMCIKTEDSLNENLYTVYYLDWGIEYSVGIQDICEMSKEFIYLPATAHKCYIPGVTPSEWNTKTTEVISQLMLTQVDCKIIEKLSSDSYTISCDIIKNLIDANL